MATSGFASDRAEFLAAINHVAETIKLNPRFVVHDYWLVRTLHALSKRLPRGGRLHRGMWAFGGGTALTTAWGYVRRYSEDIDGQLLVDEASHRLRQPQRSTAFNVASWATSDPDIDAPAIEGNRILTSYLKAGDVTRYIKLETSIIETPADNLVETKQVHSLLHRRGEPEWADAYPEIGGFELPCIRPVWIAVNKLDALHRRAMSGELGQITGRGRDLYDLWSLAVKPAVAEEIRQRTDELWEFAAGGLGRRPTPRPANGYADSPVFVAGTDAYEALRAGYETTLETTIWGDKPRFETAIKAVRALDARDG